ncbi:MAG: hypothetical protein DRO14_03115 [Thermoprotei archaeon]|nr:MAG: hypothetical protein DRO14_03115 [Thermoprotei archaeon]
MGKAKAVLKLLGEKRVDANELFRKIAKIIAKEHGDEGTPVPADLVSDVIADFDDEIFDLVCAFLEEEHGLEVE